MKGTRLGESNEPRHLCHRGAGGRQMPNRQLAACIIEQRLKCGPLVGKPALQMPRTHCQRLRHQRNARHFNVLLSLFLITFEIVLLREPAV